MLLLFNSCGVFVKSSKIVRIPAESTVPDYDIDGVAVIIEEDPHIPPLHQDQVGAVPGKDESDRTSEGKDGETSEANPSENSGVATPSKIKLPQKTNSSIRSVTSENQLQDGQQDLINSNLSATELKTQFENYKVLLMAEKKVSLSKVCQLKVSIGLEKDLEVSSEAGMSRDSMIIKPKFMVRSAKITPFVPDFDIMPKSEECIIIDPNGSDVRFSLTPKKIGVFKVSADVRLYESEDCTGKYVPKSPKSLMVNVEINKGETINHGLAEMLGVVWEKFRSFWGVLIVLLFSALLFVIRKYIKKKTNYDEKEDGAQF